MKRTILAVLIIAAIALFFGMVLSTPDTGRTQGESGKICGMLERSPWRVTLITFVLYVVVVALSLPGATIMGLAMGALFGLWQGALLVSFASTIGATLAFLTSRYLLRDFVRRRFGGKLKVIDEGMAKDGALYLFMLRLAPVFPFFLINLLMGMTQIPTRTFYWAIQLGMLAGTLIYVNAGTQLAGISSLSDIISPVLLLSFALLGMVPLIAKRIVRAIQK